MYCPSVSRSPTAEYTAKYLNDLDVWVVSHGGCGCNYIVELLERLGFRVRYPSQPTNIWTIRSGPTNINTQLRRDRADGMLNQAGWDIWMNYTEYIHRSYIPEGINKTQKILYIYGDIVNAICSKEARDFLIRVTAKLRVGVDRPEDPEDPFNYLYQYKNFSEDKRVIKLKYPYTVDTVDEAFKKLGFDIPRSEIKIKKRTRDYHPPYSPLITKVLPFYEDSILR